MISLYNLKCLAACWPRPGELADKAGAAPDKLACYLTGQKTMPPGVRDRLAHEMGLWLEEHAHRPGEFFFWTDLSYVLIAAESRKRTYGAYSLLMGGHSTDFSLEIVPANGHGSRRYRYLVFKPGHEPRYSVMAFARDGAVDGVLDDNDELSVGTCEVADEAYAAVHNLVRAVREGRQHPAANLHGDLAKWGIDFRVADTKARDADVTQRRFTVS